MKLLKRRIRKDLTRLHRLRLGDSIKINTITVSREAYCIFAMHNDFLRDYWLKDLVLLIKRAYA